MWPQLLTLSVPVVFLNSPNLSPYFLLNKFERIWLLIFSNWLCLINSHFLITKCHILYVLYKEKLAVDNWLALKGLSNSSTQSIYTTHNWVNFLDQQIKHIVSRCTCSKFTLSFVFSRAPLLSNSSTQSRYPLAAGV